MRAAGLMARSCALLACLLGLLTPALPAHAAAASVSYSTWTVSGGGSGEGTGVTLKFILPEREAQRITGPEIPVLTTRKLSDYLLARVFVQADGQACPAIDQGYDIGTVDPLAAGPGLYGFEIMFRCLSQRNLVLTDRALFETDPSHLHFARVTVDGRTREQVFTRDHTQLRLGAHGDPPAGLVRYLRLGAGHLLGSPDRLCLLLALGMLGTLGTLGARWVEALRLTAGLVAGYALSLAVSATGWVMPQADLLEASFGALLGLLAVALALPQSGRPRTAIAAWSGVLVLLALLAGLRHAPDATLLLAGAALFSASFLAMANASANTILVRVLPAALLGFLDGFVLPAEQSVLQLPRAVQLPMLVGYDLGAWLVAAVALGVLTGGVALLRGRTFLPSRRALSPVAAAVLGGVGAFWLLSRLGL